MRDSQYKSCAVQNQFTAYLIAAIRNYKRTYLRRISTALRTELPMEGHSEVMELCEETDFFCGLPLMQRLENERLFAAMQGLSERERYIFLSKVLGEMSLSEIALSLGITYGAAAMSYHRTVSRLRNAVGGGMTMALAHQHQDHIHTGTVITADPVGRHQVASILGAADDIRLMGMNGIQMGNQQHRDSTFCIEKSIFTDRLIAILAQLLRKIFLQLTLCHFQNTFKAGHIHSSSFKSVHHIPPQAATGMVAFLQIVKPIVRQAAAILHDEQLAVSCW